MNVTEVEGCFQTLRHAVAASRCQSRTLSLLHGGARDAPAFVQRLHLRVYGRWNARCNFAERVRHFSRHCTLFPLADRTSKSGCAKWALTTFCIGHARHLARGLRGTDIDHIDSNGCARFPAGYGILQARQLAIVEGIHHVQEAIRAALRFRDRLGRLWFFVMLIQSLELRRQHVLADLLLGV